MAKSENRKTTELLTFRVTPEDHAALVAAADAAGVGPTTFVRRAAFRAAGLGAPSYERRGPDPLAAAISRVLGQIGRIGSNVNQVAAVANSRGDVDVVRFDVALGELQAIRAAFRAAYDESRK